MDNNSIIISVLLVILVGAGAFYGGIKYQQLKQPALSQGRQSGNFQGQRNGSGPANRNGFRPVSGEILSNDSNGITVKLQDGSSKIVIISGNTSINKASQATKDDLKVGEKVAVFGQQNSDGSVTAQNIQLNPIVREINSQNPGQGQGNPSQGNPGPQNPTL